MNILVAISRTPETTAKISFENENTAFVENGVNFIMNPYDEWYALVRAVELKAEHGGNIVVINVGESSGDSILRKALAIGADEAVRVNANPSSAGFVADQIASFAISKKFDLILLGKETIDHNGGLVGSILAERMSLPFISYASKLSISGTSATVERDIEGGTEVTLVELPIVISAAKGLASQIIPNMRGIMMAKRKPLDVIEPIDYQEKVTIKSYSLPKSKIGVKMVDPENMDELVKLLNEEAKVL